MQNRTLKRLEELEQHSEDRKTRFVVVKAVTTEGGETAIGVAGSGRTYTEGEFWEAVEADPGLVVIPVDGYADDWESPHEAPLGMTFEDLDAVDELRHEVAEKEVGLGRELTDDEREELEGEAPRAAHFLREMQRREAAHEALESKHAAFYEEMYKRSRAVGWDSATR